MKHPRLEERWLDLAEGTLPAAEAEDLTAHLGNCEDCDARYRRLAAAHRLSVVVGPDMRTSAPSLLENLFEDARHAAPQAPPPAHVRVPRKAHRARPPTGNPLVDLKSKMMLGLETVLSRQVGAIRGPARSGGEQTQTLSYILSTGSLSITEALAMALQIAHSLAAVHEKGIVHRNLNPGNVVFLTRDLTVKLPGIGSLGGAATLDYMSPEQVRHDSVDARSDLFVFGILLYELLSGRRPFTGKTPMEMAAAILHDEPAPLAREMHPRLSRVVARCLEKRPGDRFQTARDLIFELELAATGGTPTSGQPDPDGAT